MSFDDDSVSMAAAFTRATRGARLLSLTKPTFLRDFGFLELIVARKAKTIFR